jgi:acyl-CoA thioester hydrolase
MPNMRDTSMVLQCSVALRGIAVVSTCLILHRLCASPKPLQAARYRRTETLGNSSQKPSVTLGCTSQASPWLQSGALRLAHRRALIISHAAAVACLSPAFAVTSPFDHLHPIRVYWEDTDAGGVVFYANYLKYFERARTEWLRALGFGQHELLQSHGVMFVVADTQVRYVRPAQLDDELQVSVKLQHKGRASLLIHQQALRGAHLLAEGKIRIGCVARTREQGHMFQPARIPPHILDRMA